MNPHSHSFRTYVDETDGDIMEWLHPQVQDLMSNVTAQAVTPEATAPRIIRNIQWR